MKHLGIIADGNRRWAKSHNLPVIEGHKKGIATIENLIKAASRTDLKFITFYVFSTENWGRSAEEVGNLMNLAAGQITSLAKKMAKNNIKLLILGSKNHVDPKLATKLDNAEKMTESCTGLTTCFCFNYGGEQEIADAATIAAEADQKITPETIRSHLYHPEIPNVDMVLRTSGEQRTSGFMLWRAAYAELLFLDKFFPDMTPADLQFALNEYSSRNRRFGK